MTDNTPTPYNSKTSLVLQERGTEGIDVLLFSSNVPDTDEGIAAAMRNPTDIIAGYFVKADDVDQLITALDNFKRKQKAYKVFQDAFQGCVNDPAHLARVIATKLDFVETIPVGSTIRYTLTFSAKLFMENVRDNAAAMSQVLADWTAEQGPPNMWDIQFTDAGSVWTTNRKTAEKFESWAATRYIIPTLQRLNLL